MLLLCPCIGCCTPNFFSDETLNYKSNEMVNFCCFIYASTLPITRDVKTVFVTKPVTFLWKPLFTMLHGMQTQSSNENSVCLSICLSVRLSKRDKTEERSVLIFIPYVQVSYDSQLSPVRRVQFRVPQGPCLVPCCSSCTLPMSTRLLPNTVCSCTSMRTIGKFVWRRLLTMTRWV